MEEEENSVLQKKKKRITQLQSDQAAAQLKCTNAT